MSEHDDWRQASASMVRDTIVSRGIDDAEVLRAMEAVPRHAFVPADCREDAYEDAPLPIGSGQTISQPYVVALSATLGGVREGSRVLDVGTGSGYQAAVLAEMGATVYSIERLPALLEKARLVLAATGYERVQLRVGDGKQGWPEVAPFDAILVAAAARHVPEPLIDQLAPGGRLVMPVGDDRTQELTVLERMPWGEIRRRAEMRVLFVPLI